MGEIIEDRPLSECGRLWTFVLAQLILDAQRQGRPTTNLSAMESMRAHRDLLECGPMLRHVCAFLDHEPEAISRWYRKQLDKPAPRVRPRRRAASKAA